ncbi:N-acetylmuramoyl-L-alanine amidase [Marinicrinis lubricantis]|uniref:N-acetylmuramoyl-L-alanine amidase n=1 Tax=Marinicrinis lubricantis TaxID=2086470 RepID=A0ABW1ITM1_9BACL
MKKLLYRLLLAALACLMFTNHTYAAKIVIDPGHGGSDPGAIGVNGLQEKQVNLQISKLLADELKKRGYDIVMTRTNDVYLSLQQRVEFTNRQNADLFISVHANSNPSSYISGTQVLYYDDNYPQASYPASPEMRKLTAKSKLLASYVLNSALEATNMTNKGLVPSAVYVVRMGKIPSILMETAFLSNAQDATKLKDPAFQKNMAVGMANGIERFMPVAFKDLAGHWATSAILTMYENGYVTGVGKDVFDPNRALTRAEFIAMMDRVFHFSQMEALPSSDKTVQDAESDSLEETAQNDEDQPELSAEEMKEPLQPVEQQDSQSPIDTERSTADSEASLSQGSDMNTITDQDQQGDMEDGISSNGTGSDPSHEIALGATQANTESSLEHSAVSEENAPSDSTERKVFSDLKTSHWAYYAMRKAADLGILDGFKDGTIRPDQTITRAEVAVIFNRIWGHTVQADQVAPFTDVPQMKWYSEAVYNLRAASILMGRTNTEFAPFQHMTRAEATAMLYRYLYQLQQTP